jgi:hypothetical protein
MDVDEIIFEKIQNVTFDFLEPFHPTVPFKVESAIVVVHDWDRQTTFLVLRNRRRAVFYGVAVPPDAGAAFDDKEDDLEDLLEIDITARRVEAAENSINDLLDGVNTDEVEDLPPIRPGEGEPAKDFYEKNAFWLLNPPIH